MNLFGSGLGERRMAPVLARLAAPMLALLCLGVAGAQAETRALKIHHLHTGEKAEIVFKRNGRYDADGLKKINFILRDWRRNEPTRMDPRLLDLVWQTYRASGSRDYLKVVSGYRAPATNAMLRSRSKGVAQKSQHMLGKAMDFFLPDVPLRKLRDLGLKMEVGGVGYYPNSGSPFIHLDVGNVRHWPGISRKELVSLFPDGKTLHVPSDGKPLPGYAQALTAYNSRKASGAPAVALASLGGGQTKKRGLLATLFGGGDDEADDVADVASAAPTPRKAVKPAPKPATAAPQPGIAIVAPDMAQRAEIPMVVEQKVEPPVIAEAPQVTVAALTSVPLPVFAPRSKEAAPSAGPENMPFGMAEASPAPAPAEMALAGPVPSVVPFGRPDAAPPAVQSETVVLNIPLPTWRPEYQETQVAVVEQAKSPDAIGALLAMNEPDDEPEMSSVQVASAPAVAPLDRVRTSPKSGRVERRNVQPAAPIVVPARQLQASNRLSSTDRVVTGAIASDDAQRLSANLIRTAPTKAYVQGFSADRKAVDHQRFTGNAVNFLPIASFE